MISLFGGVENIVKWLKFHCSVEWNNFYSATMPTMIHGSWFYAMVYANHGSWLIQALKSSWKMKRLGFPMKSISAFISSPWILLTSHGFLRLQCIQLQYWQVSVGIHIQNAGQGKKSFEILKVDSDGTGVKLFCQAPSSLSNLVFSVIWGIPSFASLLLNKFNM